MTQAELAQRLAQGEYEMLVAREGWWHAECDDAAGGKTMRLPIGGIVLHEHADLYDERYRDATLERLRSGKKLVPEDWKHEGEGSVE